MENKYQIGQYIQTKRKELGLTQKDLSNILAISPQAISKWETGETLPDTVLLLPLADALNTTVDKILTGGRIVAKKNKNIDIANILLGFDAIQNLKVYFGEKSTFYQGAIQGINQKMNIDFESSYKDEYEREVLLAEVIIQYLIEGYQTTRFEVESYIKSDKMRQIINRYLGEESELKLLKYREDRKLFDQIRALEHEFKDIHTLNELPGEYLRLEKGKNYWATEIDTDKGYCYGIAVDEKKIKVFTYGFGGTNMTLIHDINRNH